MKCTLALIGTLTIFVATAQAEPLIGVTNIGPFSFLVGFDSDLPFIPSFAQRLTGIRRGETIVALDARPSDGEVFALATNPDAVDERSGVYQINVRSGNATRIIGLRELDLDQAHGTNFGFDFNPTNDLLSVVSDTNQNLVLNMKIRTVTAGIDVAYAVIDEHAGKDPNITHLAYANNRADAEITELYAIDTELGILATLNPITGRLHTVGELDVNPSEIGGFEIVDLGKAYLLMAPEDSVQILYEINLLTGKTRSRGPAAFGIFKLQGITTADFPSTANLAAE